MKIKLPFATQFLMAIAMLTLPVFYSWSQAPSGFNYQLAVRDSEGKVYANQLLVLRITILDGNEAVYTETHTQQTTPFGMVNLIIGTGNVQNGIFQTIDWGASPKSLKVEIDTSDGKGFMEIANSLLTSVPYALFAASGGEPGPPGPQGNPGPQGAQGQAGPVGPQGT